MGVSGSLAIEEEDDSEYPSMGEEGEHLLIGSPRWLEVNEAWAARKGRTFSINGAIARAIARASDDEAEPPIMRITGHEETHIGRQLHYQFVNNADMRAAMESLRKHSDSQHRRYCLFEFEGRSVEWIAEDEGERVESIERSLRGARRFLRDLIVELPL